MKLSQVARLSRHDYLTHIRGVLFGLNYGDLELLRGGRVREIVPELVELYEDATQDVRDAIAFLVQDLPLTEYPALRRIAEEGLDSPDLHTRATTLTSLVGDDAVFERMLTKSSLDPVKVAAEVAAYRRSRRGG